jgi:hypothetical protein
MGEGERSLWRAPYVLALAVLFAAKEEGGTRTVLVNLELLFSRQYLTLDLLEGLCARAREITQLVFERGESLSNEELFNLIMMDMACKADELHDLQGLFVEAGVATANVLGELQATTPAERVISLPLRSLSELHYLPERRQHNV